MKRILSLVLIILTLLSVFSLASCDASDESEEIRYTITQEEWDANMNEINFTVLCEAESSNGQSSTHYVYNTENTREVTYLYKDAYEYSEWQVREGDKSYLLYEYEGRIIVEKIMWKESDLSSFTIFGRVEFDDLVYDENSKNYVYEKEGNVYTKITIHFENGVIKTVDTIMSNEYEQLVERYIISNIGTTVVEVPEFDIP